MSAATARDDLVAQCLRLRRISLDLLARQATAAQFAVEVNGAAAAAWRTFLFAEACALPLTDRLAAGRERLLPDAAAALAVFCAAGVQRILTARSQLDTIDAIASELDLHPMLFKGAVPVAEGRVAFDLGDIDVLFPAAEIEPFARALMARGYTPVSGWTRLAAPHGLPVEPHDEPHLGGTPFAAPMETIPLPGFQRLRRLSAAAHLVYLVQHVTTAHAHRRGLLRDVTFIGDAVLRCAPHELDAARSWLAASAQGAEYGRTLALSRAVVAGEPVADLARRSEVIACGNYYAASRRRVVSDSVFPSAEPVRGFFVAGRSDAARMSRRLLTDAMHADSHWHWNWLARRWPRLANGVGYVARTPYRLLLIAILTAGALRVRWRYARSWRPRAAAITAPRP